MRPAFRSFVAIAACTVILGACGNAFTAAAAVVNGSKIEAEEVDDRVESTLRQNPGAGGEAEQRVGVVRSVLANLIQRELLRQEAERRGIEVSDKKVEDELQKLLQSIGIERAREQLKQAGLTEDDLRRDIRFQAYIDELRSRVAPVSEESVRQRYERDRESFRQVRARHILIGTQERSDGAARKLVNDALARIRGGEKFEVVARDVSEDPGSKDAGGDLGEFIPVTRLDPAFGEAAWKAVRGRLIGPVKSSFGYHLIITIDKRYQPFEEAQEQIRQSITETESNPKLQELVGSLIGKARIVVNPRYGDWDRETQQIVEHRFFEPPTTEPNKPNPPPGFDLPLQTGP